MTKHLNEIAISHKEKPFELLTEKPNHSKTIEFMSDHDHQEKQYSIISKLDQNKNSVQNMIMQHNTKPIDMVTE